MKKILLTAFCMLFTTLSTIGLGVYSFQQYDYLTVSYQPMDCLLSGRQLNNPYRGWYHIYGYTLSDSAPIDMEDMAKTIAKDPNELVLLEINLRNYPDCEISPAGLSQLESTLLAWQDAGKQLILRFLYDWNGKARETEPKNISIIKRHMEQTGAIVNKCANRVFLIQGIYVGNCGEMNNSDYMSLDNMYDLATHLSSVIDPAIYLSVRTPEHYRIISQANEPLSSEDAFSGNIAARTGLFNDGILGSESDLGTYGEKPFIPSEDFTGKGTRSEEIAFQNALCNYVPNGGEAVLDNEYNDFPRAVEDLRAMHISYLDSNYDLAVLDKWRNTSYSASNGTGEDNCFGGTDGYSYIGAHLGYRYALISSGCSFDTFQDDQAKLAVKVANSGFSVSYRPFISSITILREDGKLYGTIIADTDNRFWKSGETASWEVPLDIRAYPDGNYQIFYRLWDPATNREIRLANDMEHTNHGYRLGSLTVGHKEKKAANTPTP